MTVSQGFVFVDLDADRRPRSIHLTVLSGIKGANEDEDQDKDRDLSKEEHIVVTYDYKLGEWDDVDRFAIPPEAMRVLSSK